ncbi:MAG: hypothetical protein LBR94_06405 [Desulfovibrio sp.]|jgi:hypothetical protein|nr:hypothetical protein [Desulfovibrio sp.]
MKVVSFVGAARSQFVKEALVGEAARRVGAWKHGLAYCGRTVERMET